MAGSPGGAIGGKFFDGGTLRAGVLGRHHPRAASIAAEIEAAGIPVAAVVRSAKDFPAGEADQAGLVLVHCCPVAAGKARIQLSATKRAFAGIPLVALVPLTADDNVGRAAREACVDGIVYARELEALVPTLLAVGAGQVVVPRWEYRRDTPASLSHRERQVLRLAVAGETNDSIARELYLSCSTVKSHLTSAFAKLSVRSRREAAVLLLDPQQPASRLVFSALEGESAQPEPVGGAVR
ncbi:MAG: LuxR C-terminal-related transcriptional regulator [Solirubrobacterales bacterium]